MWTLMVLSNISVIKQSRSFDLEGAFTYWPVSPAYYISSKGTLTMHVHPTLITGIGRHKIYIC